MIEQLKIKRPALGSVGFIGELYDVRSESLTSRSVLNSCYPEKLIKTTDVNSFDFDYKFTQDISDRFELFNVEGAVKISILFGLIQLEGSGKFLTDEKKSNKTISCSVKAQILTVKEKLFVSFDEIKEHLDFSALERPEYTHVITEIQWGATCLLNLEYAYSSEMNKKEIQGYLTAEFSRLKVAAVSGTASLTGNNSDLFSKKGVDIKILSDVVPRNSWPSTVEGFFNFLNEIPDLLKELNNGKGKPQDYCMVPLSYIRGLTKVQCSLNIVVRNIDESFMIAAVDFIQMISQIKRKLQDLKSELQESKKYVTEKQLKEVRDRISVLSSKESKFKSTLSGDWVLVRSGKKSLENLFRFMNEFKNVELNLSDYESFIDSYSPLCEKLSTIKTYLSQGILYLGKNDKFRNVQTSHLNSEFIVLVISSEFEKADPDLFMKTQSFFLKMASKKEPNYVYVVVDLDCSREDTFLGKVTTAKCLHLTGFDVISSDMYMEFVAESESCFVKLRKDFKMSISTAKPGSRTALELPCPLRCTPDLVIWKCHTCRTIVEYGFDDNYYCVCGKAPVKGFQYRCTNKTHVDFLSPPEPEYVKLYLSKLRPFKELNILIVGQSGVGKSTWINSIFNYLSYKSLAEAKKHGVICNIPMALTTYNPETGKAKEVHIKGKASNENTSIGRSATQSSQTYCFLWEGYYVRLIDTPGLGDSRGIEQDKINLENIIDHLGFIKEIHGLCILLKANDNRYNAVYVYCLKELLIHLHRDVVKNIVFCFTNSRSTFYHYGTGSTILTNLIESLDVRKDFGLGSHTMYFLENESFLFLCSLKKSKIHVDENMQASLAKSWEISSLETKRLFNTIKGFQPHLLKDTLSLVMTRRRILSLTKPMAEISKTVEINLVNLRSKQEEIANSNLTLEALSKKLFVTVMELKPVALERPRTVCTSPSCIDYFKHEILDVQEIEYNMHCHNECDLKNVKLKTINNSLLKNCFAMVDGKCKICNCSWESHMHVITSHRREEVKMKHPKVEQDLANAQSDKEKVEIFSKNLEAKINQYKKERDMIIETSVKFGSFLRKNSITSYNDAVCDYIEYLIYEEEQKPEKTELEKKLLENLKDMLRQYKAEVEIIQKVFQQDMGDENDEDITAEVVAELEGKLYNLPLCGEILKKFGDINRNAENNIKTYNEIIIKLAKPTDQPSMLSLVKNKMNKAYSYITDISFPSLWSP